MSLTLLSPPASEPVSLAEAKAHLKVDSDAEDALIETLITAARARAEWHTGRAFVTQSWRLNLDAIPAGLIAEIPLPPLQTVSEVAVTDADGIRRVLDASDYTVDAASEPARVIFTKAPANLRRFDAVEIAFTAGYAEVPAAIRQAILVIVGDIYAHRGDSDAVCGPQSAALLAPYRIFKL